MIKPINLLSKRKLLGSFSVEADKQILPPCSGLNSSGGTVFQNLIENLVTGAKLGGN